MRIDHTPQSYILYHFQLYLGQLVIRPFFSEIKEEAKEQNFHGIN